MQMNVLRSGFFIVPTVVTRFSRLALLAKRFLLITATTFLLFSGIIFRARA